MVTCKSIVSRASSKFWTNFVFYPLQIMPTKFARCTKIVGLRISIHHPYYLKNSTASWMTYLATDHFTRVWKCAYMWTKIKHIGVFHKFKKLFTVFFQISYEHYKFIITFPNFNCNMLSCFIPPFKFHSIVCLEFLYEQWHIGRATFEVYKHWIHSPTCNKSWVHMSKIQRV